MKWWGLTALWCGWIYFLSAEPYFTVTETRAALSTVTNIHTPGRLELLNLILRKNAHIFLYAVLVLLVWQALSAWPGRRLAKPAAFAFAVLYAASDEFHQTFVPGRVGVATDVALDGAAALLSILLIPPLLAYVRRVRAHRGGAGETPRDVE